MRALVPSAKTESLVVIDDVPEIETSHDQALVEVEAFSVNRGETFLLEEPRPGWRPGKDVAGVVVEAAPDGSGPVAGRRVVAHPSAGGWAERVAVSTTAIAVLPDPVDVLTAAALPLAGLTAMRLLRKAGPVLGRRVLITGASGGVGHFVVELGAAAGAEITAVSASTSRGARLLDLGAADVITDLADARGPYDLIMESVGGASLPNAIRHLAPDGLLLWFGQASRTPVTLDFFDFFRGPVEGQIQHFDYTRSDRSYGDDLATLVRLVAGDQLHPEIGTVQPWGNTAAVLRALRNRQIRGNAILTIDDCIRKAS